MIRNKKNLIFRLYRAHQKIPDFNVYSLMYSISQQNVNTPKHDFYFKTPDNIHINVLTKQRIYKHFNNEEFYSKYIIAKASGSSLRYPIPKYLYKVFENEKIKLSRLCNILMLLVYIKFILRAAARILINSKTYRSSHEPGIYLNNATDDNLDLKTNSVSYLKWIINFHSYVDINIFHDSKTTKDKSKKYYQKLSISGCENILEIFLYQLNGVNHIFKSIYNLIVGDLSYIFLLEEILDLKRVNNLIKNKNIKHIFFNNTDYCSRPLWSFPEDNQFEVTLLFYSINVEEFASKFFIKNKTYNGWQLAVWDRVLAWNNRHKSFIEKEFYSYKDIKISGPLDSHGKLIDIDKKPKSIAIAYFDVQPHRKSRFIKLGCATNFYDGEEAISALNKVYNYCKKNNYVLFHKRKRDIGSLINKKYFNLIKSFDKSVYKEIDPSVAVSSIVKKSDAVISMPFTSTAEIAKKLNKNNYYFMTSRYFYSKIELFTDIPVITNLDSINIEH